ncbi:MAG: hypothetical protein PHQ75_04610 [Thermoguttaceae bacterium]|nr:hypothetical protein [Thermoguttaceae bacterium]
MAKSPAGSVLRGRPGDDSSAPKKTFDRARWGYQTAATVFFTGYPANDSMRAAAIWKDAMPGWQCDFRHFHG